MTNKGSDGYEYSTYVHVEDGDKTKTDHIDHYDTYIAAVGHEPGTDPNRSVMIHGDAGIGVPTLGTGPEWDGGSSTLADGTTIENGNAPSVDGMTFVGKEMPKKDPNDPYYHDSDGTLTDQWGMPINSDGTPKDPPNYGAPPPGELTTAWGDPPRPHVSDYTVVPGSIRDTEITLMKVIHTQIDEFEKFKADVDSKASWIFFTANASDLAPQWVDDHYSMRPYTHVPGHYESGVTDPNPDATAEIIDSQNALLRTVADGIELAGRMVGLLNNAAQVYAQADKRSYEPGT
jgi:hypothetical protein